MAAVAQGDPDVIMAVTSAQLCVPIAQAHAGIAPPTKLFLPGICASPQTLGAAGSAIEGAYIGLGSLNPYDTSDPQVATYRRALDTYGGDEVPLSQFAGNAFTAVMNLKDVVDKLDPASVTAADIATAIGAGVDVPVVHDRHVHVRPAPGVLAGHLQQRAVASSRSSGGQLDQPERQVVRRHARRRPRLSIGAVT